MGELRERGQGGCVLSNMSAMVPSPGFEPPVGTVQAMVFCKGQPEEVVEGVQ